MNERYPNECEYCGRPRHGGKCTVCDNRRGEMDTYKQIDTKAFLLGMSDTERKETESLVAWLKRKVKQKGFRLNDAMHIIVVESRQECARRGDEKADIVEHDHIFHASIGNA